MQHRIESFEYKGLKLRFISAGQGPHLLLAFHGFGRSPEEFLPIVSEREMTLLSFYLPGHSGADELAVETIEIHLWCEVLEKIVERHNPQSVTVIGYSLGGRIAVYTCMNWRIKNFRLLLLAPDGIRMSVIQRFVMRSKGLIGIFIWLMRFPKAIMALILLLIKLRLLAKPLGQFLIRQLSDDSKRRVILRVYPLFRKFMFSESVTVKFLHSISDRLLIVLGRHDPVISVALLTKLPASMHLRSVLILEDASHDVLSERYIERWKYFLSE